MFKTNDFNLKVLVRLSDEVYGFVAMWYRQLESGEIIQFLNWIEFMHFHEWGCNVSIDEHGKPGMLYSPTLNGVQLDGRMKAYKQFESDADLQAQIREAAAQLLEKAKWAFDAQRKEVHDEIRKIEAELERARWKLDVINEFDVLQQLKKQAVDRGAPPEYLDLRIAELRREWCTVSINLHIAWDEIREDINDVKLRRTSWEQIMARLQPAEEAEGG